MTPRRMHIGREKPPGTPVVWVLLNAMLSEKGLWADEVDETGLYIRDTGSKISLSHNRFMQNV